MIGLHFLDMVTVQIKLWKDIAFTSRVCRCVPLKIGSCASETEAFVAFFCCHSFIARILIGSLNIYSALVRF